MAMNRNMLNDREYKGLKALMNAPDNIRFGTVAAGYAGGGVSPVPVNFDGESGSPDSYMRCLTYTPAAGHRVMLVRKGGTWVIVDRIG